MKNINFQRSGAGIRVWEEDQKSRMPFNWDRLIYIIILVVILFFALRYALNKLLYIEAKGEVMLENVKIMNTDDCRILKYYIKAGDKVQKGDTLFSYYDDPDFELGGAFKSTPNGNGGNRISLDMDNQSQKPEWIEREIYNLTRNIKGNEIRIAETRKLLNLYKSRLELTRNEVVLDLAPHGNYTEMERRIEEMQYEIERLQNEVSMANQFLGKLYAMLNDFDPINRELKVNSVTDNQGNSTTESGSGGDGEYVKYFRAPIEGTITKINFEEYEVAVKSEVILTIHKLENIYIEAYFDQEDVSDIHEGDEVYLEFPDGTSSKGIIKGYYFTTNRVPEEFQKKYEPVTRKLTVEIYPADESEMKLWKKYHKLEVTITKSKF